MISKSGYGNEMGIVKVPCSEEETISPSRMTNPVVLAHFFQICDLSDLRRFRFVSKQWHEISLTRWRTDMMLKMHCSLLPVLHEETELMKFKSKPFRRYYVNYLDDNRLWEVCGSSMTVLELDLDLVSRVDSLKRIKRFIFEDTPQLVSLTLLNVHEPSESSYFEEQEEVRVQPNLKRLKIRVGSMKPNAKLKISTAQLFHHFPNIEELELIANTYSVWNEGHPLNDFITVLESRTTENTRTRIKTLNFSRLFDDPPWEQIFALPQIKLESLHFICPWNSDASNCLLARAIQLHGRTLKKLHLHYFEPFRFVSDTLPSLTELYLEKGTCHNLKFLSQIPNLRVLQIKQTIILPADAMFEENIVSSSVEQLDIRLASLSTTTNANGGTSSRKTAYFLTDANLKQVANLMPNVKYLQTKLTAMGLQVVCTKWRELRSLHVTVDGLSDSAITGIVPGQEELVPNLTDLKYLQVLRMENSDNLTADSVFKGFFQMIRLHTLKVILPNEMSDYAVKALINRFTVFQWRWKDFKSGGWYASDRDRKEWIRN